MSQNRAAVHGNRHGEMSSPNIAIMRRHGARRKKQSVEMRIRDWRIKLQEIN
jgi:hypothetical protein